MSAEKVRQSMENLGRALERLNEVLQEERTQFMIDATIQRFEFSIALFGKTLKRQLAFEGIEATTPRETIKHAYKDAENEIDFEPREPYILLLLFRPCGHSVRK